jgi:Leucine-rich repeat (LRR) protein
VSVPLFSFRFKMADPLDFDAISSRMAQNAMRNTETAIESFKPGPASSKSSLPLMLSRLAITDTILVKEILPRLKTQLTEGRQSKSTVIVCDLHLDNNRITAFPLAQLCDLFAVPQASLQDPDQAFLLSALHLNNNSLAGSLSDHVASLSSLTRLSLQNNQISSLPHSLGDLLNLKVLFLFNNRIATLPDSLGGLSQLQELYLGS